MTPNGSNNIKNHAKNITIAVSTERLFYDKLLKTNQSKNIDRIRNRVAKSFQDAGDSNDIDSIIASEKSYHEIELEKFADSATMKSSLRQGIVNLEIIESLLECVRNPDEYKTINAAHLLPKSRRNGLPDDDARKSFRAHATRLTNLDKSRMDKTERSILEQRRKNIRVAEKVYITMQEAALGIKAGKTKDKGLGLE